MMGDASCVRLAAVGADGGAKRGSIRDESTSVSVRRGVDVQRASRVERARIERPSPLRRRSVRQGRQIFPPRADIAEADRQVGVRRKRAKSIGDCSRGIARRFIDADPNCSLIVHRHQTNDATWRRGRERDGTSCRIRHARGVLKRNIEIVDVAMASCGEIVYLIVFK